MSGGDDPFGRRDRTIIRPNPGGRLPASPAPPPPPHPPPMRPGGAPPVSTPQAQVGYPAPPPQPAGRADVDEWMVNRAAQVNPYVAASAAAPPLTPAPASPHVSVDLVMVADNILMRAAASLLLALGRLRASLSRAGAGAPAGQVAAAVDD